MQDLLFIVGEIALIYSSYIVKGSSYPAEKTSGNRSGKKVTSALSTLKFNEKGH